MEIVIEVCIMDSMDIDMSWLLRGFSGIRWVMLGGVRCEGGVEEFGFINWFVNGDDLFFLVNGRVGGFKPEES